MRFFPLDSAKEQISKLSRSGAKTIKLVDRTFNCDSGRAYELFEYIFSLDTDCCFHFEVAADLFDERTLLLLGSAPPGRIQLEAGLQSFHQPALKTASRQTDLAKAVENISALLRNRNIHIHIDLIAGLPYETLPDFEQGFDRAFALGAHTLQLGFLKLLHGSALRERADSLAISYSSDPPYEITGSPWLDAGDLLTVKAAENALQHTYNKSRFLTSLSYVLSATGIKPFALFRLLGEAAPSRATPLDDYAVELFKCLSGLSGVDCDELKDCMVFDWLGMVKGKNMPGFLKRPDKRRRQIAIAAEKKLGHVVARVETALLLSGAGVYVDICDRDPVTGLYRVLCFSDTP